MKLGTKALTVGELLDQDSIGAPEFVLKGLIKSSIGMLIAAPDMGKSHLALSVAMEHSSNLSLVGLSSSATPQKTLIISAEDGREVIKERLTSKVACFDNKSITLIRENVYVINASEALVVPEDASISERGASEDYSSQLYAQIKELGIELVIIDTVSEVIGRCDEVKHDRHIKLAFQKLCRESGAAVLLVHHVNKNEIRGEQDITMASGAGLTSVMRLCKFITAIKTDKDGAKKLHFLKANYLSPDEKSPLELSFHEDVMISPENFKPKVKARKTRKEVKIRSERPETIYIHAEPETPEEENKRRNLRKVFV